MVWPAHGYARETHLIDYKYYDEEWIDGASTVSEGGDAEEEESDIIFNANDRFLDLPNSVTSTLKQCWTHLFDLYPQVPNCPTCVAHFCISIPVLSLDHRSTLRPRIRWLSKAIPYPYKPVSIFEQSLKMGDCNFTLFRLALDRFEERARLRPDSDPFPTQTWLDLLWGSPLDNMSLGSWKRNPLSTMYGYWPSIYHWLPRVLLHTAFFTFLSLGYMYAFPFVAFEYISPSIFREIDYSQNHPILYVLGFTGIYMVLNILGAAILIVLFWDSLFMFLKIVWTPAVVLFVITWVLVYVVGTLLIGLGVISPDIRWPPQLLLPFKR